MTTLGLEHSLVSQQVFQTHVIPLMGLLKARHLAYHNYHYVKFRNIERGGEARKKRNK
jgi:hypothetical protein